MDSVRAAKFLRKESFFSKADLPYRTQLVPLGRGFCTTVRQVVGAAKSTTD